MATLKKLEKAADGLYNFELVRGATYRGTVTIVADDTIVIQYTEPRNEAVDAKLREELDPHIIEKVIKEVLPHADQ